MDCVFCGIVSGDLPAKKEYEDDFSIAFRDIHPSAPTHIVVIPKKHIVSLEQAEDWDILGQVQKAISEVIKKLEIKSAYKIVVNGGRFQDVKHVHYHVLAGINDADQKV